MLVRHSVAMLSVRPPRMNPQHLETSRRLEPGAQGRSELETG